MSDLELGTIVFFGSLWPLKVLIWYLSDAVQTKMALDKHIERMDQADSRKSKVIDSLEDWP